MERSPAKSRRYYEMCKCILERTDFMERKGDMGESYTELHYFSFSLNPPGKRRLKLLKMRKDGYDVISPVSA